MCGPAGHGLRPFLPGRLLQGAVGETLRRAVYASCRCLPATGFAVASAKHWCRSGQSNCALFPASPGPQGAATCADYFWSLCFDRQALFCQLHCTALDSCKPACQRAAAPSHTTVPAFCCDPLALPRRLPAARATKAESDLDFRALLLSLVKDLLAVAHQPAWPAAPFLLLRFAAMLQVSVGDAGACAGLMVDLSLPFSNACLSRFAHSLAGRQGPAPRRPARAAVLSGPAGQPSCTGERVDGSSQQSGWTGK